MEIVSILKKLKIKSSGTLLLINPPDDYLIQLKSIPEQLKVSDNLGEHFDAVQLFVTNKHELQIHLKEMHPLLKTDTIFWITFPKKGSGIASDLGMMKTWSETEIYNLRPVGSVSINNIWTALRFKQVDQVKESGFGNKEIKKNDFGKYVDVDNRIVTMPPNLAEALAKHPTALAFFNKLAYSHKKEYVIWILSAKQEKTVTHRIVKTVEKLLNHKKNPTE